MKPHKEFKLDDYLERNFDELSPSEQDEFDALLKEKCDEMPPVSMWADDHIL